MASPHGIDVLIITALREEYEAVLQVHAGASDGSSWSIEARPLGHEVARRAFDSEPGDVALEVVVTWATTMGGVATASVAERLIAEYKPRCIAMCGVCAGRRGDVNIGDVIIADRLWMYDAGKTKVEYDADGKGIDRFQGDIQTYNLRPDWKKAAEAFVVPESMRVLLEKRPRPIETQAHWVLEQLVNGEDPRKHADVKTKAGDFGQVLELLWKKKFVEDGTLDLTDAGKKLIDRLLLKHYEGLPDLPAFKVHVGPIGSGNRVMQDPQIFDRLSESMRKVIGLEMEAMAIGAVADEHRDKVPYMVVMKAVMDHADEWKSDAVKHFAARASAECLIAFLRKHLPPVDRFVDILDTGIAERPKEPAPSALLHAKYRYVDFYGRADMLTRLQTFCEEPAPVGVWLLHGDGGMGKTRLMIEVCQRMRKHGWAAGFLRASATEQQFTELRDSVLPALVVIDYAESRPELRALLDLIAIATTRGAPLRIVLLARNADDWWTSARQRHETLLSMHPPELLKPLVQSGERIDVVKRVANEFASFKKRQPPTAPLPALDDDRFQRALYLHLAALAWVDGISFTADTLLARILVHEEEFWKTQANALRDAIGERVFVKQTQNAVAAITLHGGIESEDRCKALLRRVNDEGSERLLEFLHWLYPGQKGTFASALEPDLLGEGMVWRTLTRLRDRRDSPTVFLDKVFRGESDRAMVTGFGLLGRLSVEHADDVRPWIKHLLDGDLEGRAIPALEAAKALGAKTAFAWIGKELAAALERAGTVELAGRLEEAGVPDLTVSLGDVCEWVSRTLLTLHAADDQSIEAKTRRARELNNLGLRQGELAQREAALASMQEAVNIRRELAQQRPETFLPVLAMSLVNLSIRRSELGQYDVALASAQEAVTIYRELACQHPNTFWPKLAVSLNNLSVDQSNLGQHEAALQSNQEAVAIYRILPKEQWYVCLPHLAMSLNNLGVEQGALGQHEAALASIQEAVIIRRALAKQRPDAFLPDLAMSLNNLSVQQSELGQREAALASTQEAVTTYKDLTRQRPDVFLPALASTLFNLALDRRDFDLPHEALLLAQEALSIRLRFYERYPEVFQNDVRKTIAFTFSLHKSLGTLPDDAWMERLKPFLLPS